MQSAPLKGTGPRFYVRDPWFLPAVGGSSRLPWVAGMWETGEGGGAILPPRPSLSPALPRSRSTVPPPPRHKDELSAPSNGPLPLQRANKTFPKPPPSPPQCPPPLTLPTSSRPSRAHVSASKLQEIRKKALSERWSHRSAIPRQATPRGLMWTDVA